MVISGANFGGATINHAESASSAFFRAVQLDRGAYRTIGDVVVPIVIVSIIVEEHAGRRRFGFAKAAEDDQSSFAVGNDIAQRDGFRDVHKMSGEAFDWLAHAADGLERRINHQFAFVGVFIAAAVRAKTDRRRFAIGEMHLPFDVGVGVGDFANAGLFAAVVGGISSMRKALTLPLDTSLRVAVRAVGRGWRRVGFLSLGQDVRRFRSDEIFVGAVAEAGNADGRVDAIGDWHMTPWGASVLSRTFWGSGD